MEPLQIASYVHQCGRYDEMIDFRQFFRTLIRHISTPMTSWQKIFCICIAHSYYASHKNFLAKCVWLLVVLLEKNCGNRPKIRIIAS